MTSPFSRLVLACALTAAAVLPACGNDKEPRGQESPSASASPSPIPSPTPSPSPPPLRSPLTGLPVPSLKPVAAVKIDNVGPARPQAGLQYADVVYEELVEGGMTRFMAVFSSQAAPKLGPVRSVRESDLEILAAYGRVLFAYSGGNDGVERTVSRANVLNASYDAATPAYYRQQGRRAPYHLFTSTDALFAAKPGAVVAKDVGLRFGAAPAAGAAPVRTVSLTWSPFSRTGWTWDAAGTRWLRSQNGAPSALLGGGRMSAENVVVQYVGIRPSKYVDVTGARTPYTVTVGTGRVEVYRDGKRYVGTWKRPSAGAPTRYVDAAGKDIPLAPGPVWILLAPSNTRAVVG